MFKWILYPPDASLDVPDVGLCPQYVTSNVSQDMTNVKSCKEMFQHYNTVYYHVDLCNNVFE